MSDFFVRASYATNSATVHRADCPACRDGRGRGGQEDRLEAVEWLGPYASREEAFRAARNAAAHAAGCDRCRP